MQLNENYSITKTILKFSFFGGIGFATSYTFFALLGYIFINPITAVPLWILLGSIFLMTLLCGLAFSFINGIILFLIKFRVSNTIKYFAVFFLGFLVTLPITLMLMVGFGANKTNAEIGLAVLMFGLSGGVGNIIASKFVLPKS